LAGINNISVADYQLAAKIPRSCAVPSTVKLPVCRISRRISRRNVDRSCANREDRAGSRDSSPQSRCRYYLSPSVSGRLLASTSRWNSNGSVTTHICQWIKNRRCCVGGCRRERDSNGCCGHPGPLRRCPIRPRTSPLARTLTSHKRSFCQGVSVSRKSRLCRIS
jgi:hypothetical protein